jgi:hypothetical protein
MVYDSGRFRERDYRFYLSKPRPDERTVLPAQDAVYGTVVGNMITPVRGPAKARQPVFDDMALSQLAPGSNI